MKGKMWFAALAALALVGCKDLKEQQHGAYVGDSQTKVYYKNVGEFKTKVPKERRVFFRSMQEAGDEGYSYYQEVGDEGVAPTSVSEDGAGGEASTSSGQ